MIERIVPLLKILALVGAFAAGSYVEDLQQTNASLAKDNQYLTSLNERKDKINALEEQIATLQVESASAYEKGRQEAQLVADDTIARYKSGNVKLREQLSCSRELLRSVPDSATTGRLSIPEGNCGLSEEDVRFLVQFAAETNRLKEKVNSLIDTYNQAKIKIDQFNASKENK